MNLILRGIIGNARIQNIGETQMARFSLDKGVAVGVKGRIRNQRYTDANGVEKQMSEIIASQFKVIDGPL